MAIIDRAAEIVERGGVEAWSRVTAEEIIGAEDAKVYRKSTDILEVWFDSGSTFFHVLRGSHRGPDGDPGFHTTGPEADLYLEGHDQHRGWFHSSLLLGCAIEGRAPYRALLTHGFTVDGQGRKMSKSLGNIIEIGQAAKDPGSEVTRLWVALTDYSSDPPIDKQVLARVVDAYRRIRNTLRFMLASVSDFDAGRDALPLRQLLEVDRWALARAAQLQAEIAAHYERYEFQPVATKLQLFCSEDLGAFWLDLLKDRLYTTAPKSLARRSAQTALWHITHAMLRWMAPFLSFTAEEAWAVLAPGKSVSIFCETFVDTELWLDDALLVKWQRIREIRDSVNVALEDVRSRGEIGSSLQAKVEIGAHGADLEVLHSLGDDLRFVLITSAASVSLLEDPAATRHELSVRVEPIQAPKCERCWHYRDDVGSDAAHPTICGRCVSNLFGAGEVRGIA
jgi:isoleucyl-tRNA synthetase